MPVIFAKMFVFLFLEIRYVVQRPTNHENQSRRPLLAGGSIIT